MVAGLFYYYLLFSEYRTEVGYGQRVERERCVFFVMRVERLLWVGGEVHEGKIKRRAKGKDTKGTTSRR